MLNYELSQFLEKLSHIGTPVILSVTFQPASKARAAEAPPQVIVAVGGKALAQTNPILRGGPAADVLTLIPKALYEFAKAAEAARKKPAKNAAAAEPPHPEREETDDATPAVDTPQVRRERDTPPDFSPVEEVAAAETAEDRERPVEVKPEPPRKSTTSKGPARTLFE